MLKINGKIILAVFIGLSLSAPVVEAKDHHKEKHKEKHKKDKDYYEYYEHEHEHHHNRDWEPRPYPVYETPPIAPPNYPRNFDDRIRYIVIENRYTGYEDLPPGIRKKIARGKPIPPGLAYRLVPVQVLNTLPAYPGAEWRVYGQDLVLVNLTNQLIQQTILGLFR